MKEHTFRKKYARKIEIFAILIFQRPNLSGFHVLDRVAI